MHLLRAGFSIRVIARADRLAGDLVRFVEFVTGFDVDLDLVHSVDMRFDNMVVCGEG